PSPPPTRPPRAPGRTSRESRHPGPRRAAPSLRRPTQRAGPASLSGMKRDMPDDAGAHLVSGHPPNAQAPRTPLQNRVAIVTGGTGALGQAVTLRFLADGAIVAVPYAVETERAELRARVAPAQRDRLVT